MLRDTKYDEAKPVLTTEEWLGLGSCILALNKATTHENVRAQVLSYLIDAVPFEAACFFIASSEREQHAGCLIAQRLGSDYFAETFEKLAELTCEQGERTFENGDSYFYVLRRREEDSGHGRVAENVNSPFNILGVPQKVAADLECVFVAMFGDEMGKLATLLLARNTEQGVFLPRDILVLKALAPHIAHKIESFIAHSERGRIDIDALSQEYDLTRREMDVISCVAYGMTAPEITKKLNIQIATTKKHLEHIYRKVGVNNRMSLMRLAQQYLIP